MAKLDGGDSQAAGSEKLILDLDRRIEALKVKYTLFFSGDEKLPPEKMRVELEKSIRLLLYSETKSARLNMLIQNLAAKFSLFNNLWLKRLNELESGLLQRPGRPAAAPPAAAKKPAPPPSREAVVSLHDDATFASLAAIYRELQPATTAAGSEKVINAMKAKLASHGLQQARIILSLHDGKLNIKIKSR